MVAERLGRREGAHRRCFTLIILREKLFMGGLFRLKVTSSRLRGACPWTEVG